MKCPKCGYISFDHNKNCPKCKKSLREEAAKMNLPDYEPAPPFLLASLVGEETSEKISSFGVDMSHLPGFNIEENTMMSGQEYEDLNEEIEINLHYKNAGQRENAAKGPQDIDMDETDFREQPEFHNNIDEKEFVLELFDFSSDHESNEKSFLTHNEEGQSIEPGKNPTDNESAPLLFEDHFMEKHHQKPSKEEIAFDPESHLLALENEIRQNEAAEHKDPGYEEISFDPVAMGLEPGGRKDEELVITSDDFDFELLENEDEEKKS